MKTKTKNSFNWLTDKKLHAQQKQERLGNFTASVAALEKHDEYIHSPEYLEAVAAYRQEQAQEVHEAIYKLEEGKRIADALKAATMARLASGELVIPSYEYESKPLSQMGFEWQMKKQLKNLLNGTSKAITLNADVSAVSWSWTSSNSSCVSLSGQTDTDTQSSITATANATGNATLSCVMTDVDGTTYSGSLNVAVSAAPVTPNHVTGITVSPTEIDVTSGDSINQVFTAKPTPSDDGSYSYNWHWSKSSAGTLTPSSDGKTCTLTGTAPSTAGTYIVLCTVTDSYNTSITSTTAYGKVVVTAVPEEGTIIPTNCSLPQIPAYSGRSSDYYTLTVDLDEEDDGTYSYVWTFNGNGTGYGNAYSDSGHTKAMSTGATTKGTQTIYIGGASFKATGKVTYGVKVTDAHGNTFDSGTMNWTIS